MKYTSIARRQDDEKTVREKRLEMRAVAQWMGKWTRWGLLVVLFSGALLLTPGNSAAQVVFDGSLGPPGALPGPHYVIPAELGQRPRHGPNLFHSFATLNVHRGESVTFTGPDSIENIIGRITGGTASHIDGMLRSTIPGASLFLLNPAGILFGPEARLDVQGAFHASTADYLRLADGTRFPAHLSLPTILSVAPPEAFGFLSAQSQAILVEGSDLQGATGTTLSLSGGDIAITAARFQVPGGHIHLESMATSGEIPLPASAADRAEASGRLMLRDSLLDVRGPQAGRISIRSGQLVLDQSGLNAETMVDERGHEGEAGTVTIAAAQMLLRHGAFISVGTIGNHDAGAIEVTAEQLKITTGSLLTAASIAAGEAGLITIQTGDLLLAEGGQIDVGTTGTGSGGLLQVNATAAIRIVDRGSSVQPGGLVSNSFATGNAGDIALETPVLHIQGGLIQSITEDGDGGAIMITAQRVLVSAGGQIDVRTNGRGEGGTLSIRASEELTLDGRGNNDAPSALVSLALGSGDAGAITVETGRLAIRHGASITGNTAGTGNGGVITLTATAALTLDGHSASGEQSGIFSNAFGSGGAGDIRISTPTLRLQDGLMQAATGVGGGDAGSITIEAQRVTLTQGGQIDSRTLGEGQGGNIAIAATERVSLIGRNAADAPSGIVSITEGAGNAGTLTLQVGQLNVRDGALISANTASTGAGGTITVTASDAIVVSGQSATGAFSGIFNNAFGSGDAGLIQLDAPSIRLDGGAVQALTTGAGNAGIILAHGNRITLKNGAQIDNRTEGTGEGGLLVVTATDTLQITGRDSTGHPSALLSTTTDHSPDAGDAGAVLVAAPHIVLTEGGEIQSLTRGSGAAGPILLGPFHITVEGNRLEGGEIRQLVLASGGQINSSSFGSGAGNLLAISVQEQITIRDPESGLFNIATGPGDAGTILLAASHIRLADGGQVETSTSGQGTAGALFLGAFTIREANVTFEGVPVTRLSLVNGGRINSNSRSAGEGGVIAISVADTVEIAGEGSGLFSVAQNTGDAGAILVAAPHIRLTDHAQIQTSTGGAGNAGVIGLGSFRIEAEGFTFAGSAIESLSLLGEARIASNALPGSTGEGGSIFVSGKRITLSEQATIEATTAGSQDAGDIVIGAFVIGDEGFILRGQQGQSLTITEGASISTSTLPDSQGTGGLLILFADAVRLEQGSRIEAVTAGTGDAGIIVLGDLRRARALLADAGNANDMPRLPRATITTLSLLDKAQIASSSLGQSARAGDAGDIHLHVVDTLTLRDSAITTAASQSDGGNINVQARFTLLTSSRITAEAQGSRRRGSDGGNVTIAADFVVLNDSRMLANAFGGDGGNIMLTAVEAFLASADSQIDASSRFGAQGEVAIQSPVTEVSGTLAPLAHNFANAAELTRGRCAARFRQSNLSSFVLRGREGIPQGPEDLLLSPVEYIEQYAQQASSFSPTKEGYAQKLPSALLVWECPR